MVSGVFPLFSSLTGLPLEDIVDMLHRQGLVVDWLDFHRDGIRHGWKEDRMLERIRLAVSESQGLKCGDEVVKRLKFCLEIRPADGVD